MKIKIFLFFCVFFLCVTSDINIVCATTLDEYDFDTMDDFFADNDFDITFSELAKIIMEQDYSKENGIIGTVSHFFISELASCLKIVVMILGIIITGAAFKGITEIFKDNSVIKTGTFITYMAVSTLLFTAFETGFTLSKETASNVLDFLYALIPTFFCAVTFVKGSITGSLMYQWTGLCVSIVNVVVVKLLLPMVNYYVILSVVNYGTEDGRFNHMCLLIKKVILFVNRCMMGVVLGITSIKSLTVPLADSIKNTALKKAVSMIPGIGNGAEAFAETVAGTGNLIKNSIGMAGLLAVVFIVALPFIKLMVMNLVFRLLAAITEPITQKNIVSGVNSISEGIGLLQYVICTSCLTMMINISIICIMTGV